MNITMEKFEYPKTLIKEFKYWAVQLRPKQVTLGSLVLINKSDAKHLGELTSEEWAEFAEVSAFAENLLKSNFPVEKFNYLALMMKDPNVHFHLIPRYSDEVEFAGQKFSDPEWPLATQMNSIEIDEKVFDKLLETLKS
jgi:diadenosine tetraphosphate (Ap4A) HIT family hydrolase